MIREHLQDILQNYQHARSSTPFGKTSPIAHAFTAARDAYADSKVVKNYPTIRVKASYGKGNWTAVPWIAFLDERETNTTQHGVYPVLLFADDMSGFSLNLSQGVTDVIQEHGEREGKVILGKRAEALRKYCAPLTGHGFELETPDKKLGKKYEMATAAYKFYARDAMPTDDILLADLATMLAVYKNYLDDNDTKESDEEAAIYEIKEPAPLTSPPSSIDDGLDQLFMEPAAFGQMIDTLTQKKNLILQGAPGVGKTFAAKRLAYAVIGEKAPGRVEMVQFHQSYAYEDFIQGYRPTGQGFDLRNGVFYDFCQRAAQDPNYRYVFIIDEINRGNLSKIFGELMMLIEPDKRGPEWGLYLTYQDRSKPKFYVPKNLYLLGLMNTADRSIAMVDYALRRRFGFIDVEPGFATPAFRDHLSKAGASAALIDRVVGRMQQLNAKIAADTANLGPGFRIGHSFFSAPASASLDEAWYRRIIQTEIAPLIREYWFDDAGQAETLIEQLLSA